jgi:serine/threonine protein kinase
VDEDLRRDFMHELQILSEVDHPGIVQLYGACVSPPNLCMVMELCDTSVYALLHNSAQPVSEKEIVTMAVSMFYSNLVRVFVRCLKHSAWSAW